MFISVYIFPLIFITTITTGFHSPLEAPEQAEDHSQLESQVVADAYLIIHSNSCQWPFVHGFSY